MKPYLPILAALALSYGGAALAAQPGGPAPVARTVAASWPARANTSTARQITDALNLLEAKGYGNFSDFHALKNGRYGATVTQNGRRFSVTVDPAEGQVASAT